MVFSSIFLLYSFCLVKFRNMHAFEFDFELLHISKFFEKLNFFSFFGSSANFESSSVVCSPNLCFASVIFKTVLKLIRNFFSIKIQIYSSPEGMWLSAALKLIIRYCFPTRTKIVLLKKYDSVKLRIQIGKNISPSSFPFFSAFPYLQLYRSWK